ncbi:putative chaperonin containing T-complex 1 eta subunit, tcph protein [Gregarina niphandrodes]|uniref:CCT-eta n=1 Tax=Gregarina niphandrodes TaxID=110365 RepID=A0A023B2J6_GRENI|nr:putative chaperonin containing T-complex 1 eta subunit, tcph protein [Gregarina niphandrodes]EZG50493.1 putative chaperonin containing T-complex 1 eta subunit, tcph protein [Gregarina niphandrodes]|eukprot:XP_011132015.1 putative chaperonin containing T-complex 1 eta subunit, tcph protein [Gregarina niphandrodes]
MMMSKLPMMHQPIILLKSGTEAASGTQLILSNIRACNSVVETVKTTLGPMGQDKLIQTAQKTHITNDGATIMELLCVVHPAAKILVDISQSQDAEIGDGTTSVVVLAGELLNEARQFIEDGVHPRLIIAGYQKACAMALERVQQLGIDLTKYSDDEMKTVVEKCAETSLNSKLLADHKQFFGCLIYRAVSRLSSAMGTETSSTLLNKSMVGVKKVAGGSVTDSFCVEGVAFAKCFSYAGFENAPKSFTNPKILLLDLELELKAEKENAEIRVDNASEYQKMIDTEWQMLLDRLQAMVDAGANIVLSRQAIGDIATQYFADRSVFCAGRVEEGDMKRLVKVTGGRLLTTVTQLDPKVLGTCGTFEERQIGKERYNVFEQCPRGGASTIVLRGGANQFIDEAERSLNDALMTCCRALQSQHAVGGGGAVEMEVSAYIRQTARAISGKQQLIFEAFGRAFEVIPRVLAQNSGLDAVDVVNKLRQLHNRKDDSGRWMGVDCLERSGDVVIDSVETFVWEPMSIKLNSYAAATEAACAVLSIDEMVKNPKSNAEPVGKVNRGPGRT